MSSRPPDAASLTIGDRPTGPRAPVLLKAALPILAIGCFVIVPAAVIWSGAAAGTLGFDFLAYHQAATRVVSGEPLYDPSVQETGGFGLFYYPPPFVLAMLPLALRPAMLLAVGGRAGLRHRRALRKMRRRLHMLRPPPGPAD